jgi:hypothetical protein
MNPRHLLQINASDVRRGSASISLRESESSCGDSRRRQPSPLLGIIVVLKLSRGWRLDSL